MKRIRGAAALALALMLAAWTLGGCRPPLAAEKEAASVETTAAQEETESTGRCFSMATNGNWSSSFKGEIMEQQISELEERTGGGVTIRLYDRSRLGNDAHLISGVQAGTIDIMQSSPATQTNVVPEAAFFDIPGLFDTLEEWNALLGGNYRQTMQKYYEDAGLVLLDVFAYSWRTLSSRTPVVSREDLQGLRIRTIENKYHEAFWSSLGAIPIPYDYAELYFCISEGMADAQENLLDVILEDNLHELQSNITFTHHLPMISAIAMRKELYDSLKEEEREALLRFSSGLKQALMDEMPAEEERLAETLDHDYKMELKEPTAELRQAIREGSDTVIALLREELGDRKTDAFLAEVEEIRRGTAESQTAEAP